MVELQQLIKTERMNLTIEIKNYIFKALSFNELWNYYLNCGLKKKL